MHPQVKSGADDSSFRYRYLVALFGFLSFSDINSYRVATTISLVAMTNSTKTNSREIPKNSTISCPVSYSDEADFNILEDDGPFNWSPEVQGYILGSGFLGFVFTLIPGGLLAETYGAKVTILSGLVLSTASHILSPLAAWHSSYTMIAMQLARGLGQGFIPPAYYVLATKWFPKSESGFLNALAFSGYSFGALISGFFSGEMCSSTVLGKWASVYYIYGGLGIFLCLCFHIFVYETPKYHPRISDAELAFILIDQDPEIYQKRPPTPWKKILTSTPVYAMTFAMFGAFWGGCHFLSIQPLFLGTVLHFTVQENGFYTALPLMFQVVLIFVTSSFCKWLNARNYVGVNTVRKGGNLIFCLGYSLCFLGVTYTGCRRLMSTVLSVAALSFVGFSACGCLNGPIDMAPNYAGTLMGISSAIGSISAFIFPIFVGFMTTEQQTFEEWNIIFMICIGIVMSSGIVFCIFGSAEVQPWNYSVTEKTEQTHPVNNQNKEPEDVETPAEVKPWNYYVTEKTGQTRPVNDNHNKESEDVETPAEVQPWNYSVTEKTEQTHPVNNQNKEPEDVETPTEVKPLNYSVTEKTGQTHPVNDNHNKESEDVETPAEVKPWNYSVTEKTGQTHPVEDKYKKKLEDVETPAEVIIRL